MLREAGRIAESRGAIASGVPADELADLHDVCWAAPADISHHFRCIVAELLLDQLEHAVRVLKGTILLGLSIAAIGIHLVLIIPSGSCLRI